MESAEKTLSEMVSATDFDTTRFFVEEDKSAQRDPEAIVQEMKAKRQRLQSWAELVADPCAVHPSHGHCHLRNVVRSVHMAHHAGTRTQ